MDFVCRFSKANVVKKDFVQRKWELRIALMLTNLNVDVLEAFIIFKLFDFW